MKLFQIPRYPVVLALFFPFLGITAGKEFYRLNTKIPDYQDNLVLSLPSSFKPATTPNEKRIEAKINEKLKVGRGSSAPDKKIFAPKWIVDNSFEYVGVSIVEVPNASKGEVTEEDWELYKLTLIKQKNLNPENIRSQLEQLGIKNAAMENLLNVTQSKPNEIFYAAINQVGNLSTVFVLKFLYNGKSIFSVSYRTPANDDSSQKVFEFIANADVD